jgi:fatty-acyl-CoA synthase
MTPDIGLGNWMFQRALRTPHRAALTFEGTTWTYGQLQDRIDRLASALRANGVCQGDRVGFMGFNQPAFLETLFAAARLGAIFVPLNFRLTGPELSYIIGDGGVHTLIVDAPHRPVIDPIRAELPCRRFFSADQPAEGWPAIRALIEAHAPIVFGTRTTRRSSCTPAERPGGPKARC